MLLTSLNLHIDVTCILIHHTLKKNKNLYYMLQNELRHFSSLLNNRVYSLEKVPQVYMLQMKSTVRLTSVIF